MLDFEGCALRRNMKPHLDRSMSFQVPKARSKVKTLPREYHVVRDDYVECKDSQKVSLKRISPYSSSVFDAYTGKPRNVEAGKSDKRQRMHPATFQKKEDAIVYPGEILSERDTHDSFRERLSGYNYLGRANVRNAVTDCTLAESSERNDSDDDACSVGSCSVNGKRENKFSNCSINVRLLQRDLLSSDAESYSCSTHVKENCSCCLEEKVKVSVHSLELHAYRCTLQALYVSGPLSWEQEELLTNLRIMLHISNDDHLTELRNLIPSRTSK